MNLYYHVHKHMWGGGNLVRKLKIDFREFSMIDLIIRNLQSSSRDQVIKEYM